jgi:hypothetical protein
VVAALCLVHFQPGLSLQNSATKLYMLYMEMVVALEPREKEGAALKVQGAKLLRQP